MSENKTWRPRLPLSLKKAISEIFESDEFLKNKYEGKEANFLKDIIWDKLAEVEA